MSQRKSPQSWRTSYAAAMLESDSTRLSQCIESAYDAIHARLRELPQTIAIQLEQAELQSALKFLSLLKANSNMV